MNSCGGGGEQCSRFDAAKFLALTDVYSLLLAVCPSEDAADAKPLDVKLHECFTNAIDRETDGANASNGPSALINGLVQQRQRR
jgi:hypothetical protein